MLKSLQAHFKMLSGVLWFNLKCLGDSEVLFSHAATALDCYYSMLRTLDFH